MRNVLIFLVLLTLVTFSYGCRRSTTGHTPWVVPDTGDLVDQGDPVLPAAEGFAGSAVCRDCHPGLFEPWADTFHSLSVRKTDKAGATGKAVVADANDNGVDDFKDGLDLATDPDFAFLGANAPVLGFGSGDQPYNVTIGDLTYPVWRTLGGNGFWRQRYITQIGLSTFILPVQYNEETANWVPYEPEDWYDKSGNPLFTDEDTVADEIDPAVSFDLHCIGCHSTGLDVEFSADAGQYLTGYQELNIGCETCHGPGKAHVDSAGNPDLILNPADLLDGTEEGMVAAGLVCGQCHNRGVGNVPSGGSDPTLYPWQEGSSTFPPGNTNFDDYFTMTTNPEDYWRHKDNPMGFTGPTPDDPTDDTVLAARSGEMQFIDLLNGAHAPQKQLKATCFACHNPHARRQRHQTRQVIVADGITYTGVSQFNNALCLSCHRGEGDFAGITPADVDAITDSSAPPSVVNGVIDHLMDHSAMPIDPDQYDPAGDGTGRCTLCHMPFSAISAEYLEDADGHLLGDLHSHNFKPIWPNVSELTEAETGTDQGITNSCSICHPLDANDNAAKVIDEWVSDPNGNGALHADTPSNFQTGVANPGRDGGVACVSCHTTPGFVRVQVFGSLHDLTDPGDAGTRAEMIRESIKHDRGITCDACHGRNSSGNFASGVNPLRIPKAQLCGTCHNNQTVLFVDYVDEGEIVRHPQREMLAGDAGAEVPGEDYNNSVHASFPGPDCTRCHYFGDDRSHDFEPTLESCQGCHSGLNTFDRPQNMDYDDNGEAEGIQTEVAGCLEILKDAILAAPTTQPSDTITYDEDSGTFLINGDEHATDELDPVGDEALMGAMFDHNYVNFDASLGIHNTSYALQLIQNAYVALTGNPWPGDVR